MSIQYVSSDMTTFLGWFATSKWLSSRQTDQTVKNINLDFKTSNPAKYYSFIDYDRSGARA